MARPALVLFEGQSLCVGRSSILPADLFAAMGTPVAGTRALMLNVNSPRILGAGTPGYLTTTVDPAALKTAYDLKETLVSGDGATSAWAFNLARKLRGLWSDRAAFFVNSSVGGRTIEEARGLTSQSTGATNAERSILAACQHVRAKAPELPRGGNLFSVAVLIYDEDNANRANTSDYFYSQVESWFLERKRWIQTCGGAERYLLVTHSGAGIYIAQVPSSDIHDVSLRLALNRADAVSWGPGYILESATGAYAQPAPDGDSVHLAAIAEARKGLYQEFAVEAALAGTKRMPLFCDFTAAPINAKHNASGRYELTFANPRATALALDTTFVTDPGGNLPYGFGYAPGTGKVLSATKRFRRSSFQVVGTTTLSMQLETIATGADATPDAASFVNYAAFYDGVAANGPDRGARGCLRNDGSGDTIVIPTGGASYSFALHDYAMPQRLPTVLSTFS